MGLNRSGSIINLSISGNLPSGLQLGYTEGTWDYNLVSSSSINSVGVYPLIITLSHKSPSVNDEFTLTFLAADGSEES